MILVHGHVVARVGAFDEALALSQEHVARSRAEPGCIAHAVHRVQHLVGLRVELAVLDDLGDLVAHVLVHELAHHFGRSDADIASVDQWWE